MQVLLVRVYLLCISYTCESDIYTGSGGETFWSRGGGRDVLVHTSCPWAKRHRIGAKHLGPGGKIPGMGSKHSGTGGVLVHAFRPWAKHPGPEGKTSWGLNILVPRAKRPGPWYRGVIRPGYFKDFALVVNNIQELVNDIRSAGFCIRRKCESMPIQVNAALGQVCLNQQDWVNSACYT